MVNSKDANIFMNTLYHAYGAMSLTFICKITNNGWSENTRKLIEPLNIQDGIDTYTSLGIYSGESRATEECAGSLLHFTWIWTVIVIK